MNSSLCLIFLLFLTACQENKEVKVPLVLEGVWQLTEIAGKPALNGELWLERPEVVHVSLEQNGTDIIKINGYSGCNGFGRIIEAGQPEMDRYVIANQRGCGKEIGRQEANLLQILSGYPTFSFDDDAMTIEITGENGKIAHGRFLRKL